MDNLNTGCLHYWQCKYRLSTILAVQGVPVVYNFGSASTGCLQFWQCKYRLSTILAVQVPVVYNFGSASTGCLQFWQCKYRLSTILAVQGVDEGLLHTVEVQIQSQPYYYHLLSHFSLTLHG